ncbi:MAG: hypothetical protein C0511_13310 [Hyphomicrobium sp.]|nr:hypothetical protein [Hyphomicrobium sp.]PPC80647.1 MAG: hypothetical protein CTY40_08785 [Hyphomicrobium sp.]
MNRPDVATEPSMDDILASIRKIIAEEPSAARPLPEVKSIAAEPHVTETRHSGNNPTELRQAAEGTRHPASFAGPTTSPIAELPAAPQQVRATAQVAAMAEMPKTPQQANSLNLALNGLPGTPMSGSKAPISFDDLADLMEDVPQSPLRPAARAAAPVPPPAAGGQGAAPVRVAPPVSGSFAELMRTPVGPASTRQAEAAGSAPSFGSLAARGSPAQLNGSANDSALGSGSAVPTSTASVAKMDLGAFVPTRTPPATASAPTFGAGLLKAPAAAVPAPIAPYPVKPKSPNMGDPEALVAAAAVTVAASSAEPPLRDGNPFRRPVEMFDKRVEAAASETEAFSGIGPALRALPMQGSSPSQQAADEIVASTVMSASAAPAELAGNYEVIAAMPAKAPKGPPPAEAMLAGVAKVAAPSDASPVAAPSSLDPKPSVAVTSPVTQLPDLDHAVIESTAAAQSALGALAAGLAASGKSFVPSVTAIPETGAVMVATHAAPPGPDGQPVAISAMSPPAAAPAEVEVVVEVAPEVPSAVIDVAPPPGEQPVPATVAAVLPKLPPALPVSAPPVHALPAAPSQPEGAAAGDAGKTTSLEDTVAELLRPMLRQWLADNMPRIVEKALRIEVAESVRLTSRPPVG